jgi:uncharacterized membrane protein YccC
MWRTFACPEGATKCDDVSVINVLLLFFPGVVVLAFLLADPLRRFVPRRRFVGATIGLMGAVVYLYFSGSSLPGSLLGFVIGTAGIALSFGRRERRTDATPI